MINTTNIEKDIPAIIHEVMVIFEKSGDEKSGDGSMIGLFYAKNRP